MTLLEEAAVEIHGARILTLDTYCHPLVRGSDGKHEHPSTELSATVIWYRKRGYVEFRVSVVHVSPRADACHRSLLSFIPITPRSLELAYG